MRTIQPNKLPNNVPQFIGLADGRVSLYPGGTPLPPAPTGFQVYAILPPGVGGNQTITFEWSSYTFPGGLVDPGFVIERATSLAGPWADVPAASGNDTTINLTDAYNPASAYYFRIRAVDFSGSFVSAWSNVVTVPAAPTLSTWAAVSDSEIEYAAAAGAWSQFNWAYSDDQTNWIEILDAGLNGTISGLDPDTLYYGTVQGVDASGNLSLWATPLSATTAAAVPTGTTADPDTFYGSLLYINGDTPPVGVTWYYDISANGTTWSAAGTRTNADPIDFTVSGLTPQTAYYVRARASADGSGVYSRYSYLGGGASPGSTVTTVWDPSVLGSKLKGMWRLYNDAVGNFVFSSADNSTPCSPGDSIRFVPGVFGTTIDLSQATSGDRPTAQSDGAQFDTTSDKLVMSSSLSLASSTQFSLYVCGSRASGTTKFFPLGSSTSGAGLGAWVFQNDGQMYMGMGGSNFSQLTAGVSGTLSSRFRRASGGGTFLTWTGRGSEGSCIVTGTVTGATSFNQVGADVGSGFNGSTSNRFQLIAVLQGESSQDQTDFQTWLTNNGYPSVF